MKIHLPKKNQKGFTLIELMVSLSLFTIAALAMVTSLYTVNAAWKRVQAMRTVMDNLNFAVENISRNIRTANTLACAGNLASPNCPFSSSGSTILAMNSTLGDAKAIEYSLQCDNGTKTCAIKKRVSDTFLGQGAVWSGYVALTTPEISIDRLKFYVDGALTGDNKQPGVLISIQGKATASGQTIPFSIQTYASQRNIE